MNDPLKNLSLPAVFFIVGLIVLFGFVYVLDKVDAAEKTIYDVDIAGTGSISGTFGTMLTGITTSSIDIDAFAFELSRTATTTGTWTANIGYGYSLSGPSSSYVHWLTTTTGSLADVTSTLSWKRFTLSDTVTIPQGADLVLQWNPGTDAWAYTHGGSISSAQPRRYHGTTNLSQGPDNYNMSVRIFGDSPFYATGEESILFRFPEDGMTEVPNFSNWVVALNGLQDDQTYYVSISAYLSSSTVSSTEVGENFTDISSFTGATSSPFWAFPKSETLTPPGDGLRTWELTAKICAERYCFIPLATVTSTITTNYPGTVPDTPYTDEAGPFENPDDYLYGKNGNKLTREQVAKWSRTGWCDPPATSTSWWGEYFSADHLSFGMCRIMEVLLKPDEKDYSAIGDAFDSIKKIYPFKYAWDIVDTAKDNAILPDTTLSPTLTLDMRTAFANETASVTLLSSSTLSNLVGSEQTTNIKTTERYVIWSLVIGMILKALLI